MENVWVFQDLAEGLVRIFAREEDAKKFALNYFDEAFSACFRDEPLSFENEKERFMEDWSADDGMIRLEEVGVE